MSIKSVMPSNHLILCRPLLLLPSIFPSIRVFSNKSDLRIRWPKYWSFSFSISPPHEYSGLISFRMNWLDLLAVQGTLKSLLQYHRSKASILRCSAFLVKESTTLWSKINTILGWKEVSCVLTVQGELTLHFFTLAALRALTWDFQGWSPISEIRGSLFVCPALYACSNFPNSQLLTHGALHWAPTVSLGKHRGGSQFTEPLPWEAPSCPWSMHSAYSRGFRNTRTADRWTMT